VFLEGTAAELEPIEAHVTAFSAELAAERSLDLRAEPFRRHEAQISSPSSYAESQPLGSAMREAGIDVFRYRSARDPSGGTCVGAFSCGVFRREPRKFTTLRCYVARAGVEFSHLVRGPRPYLFERTAFELDGRLPPVPLPAPVGAEAARA
jgi:hypothetical protein